MACPFDNDPVDEGAALLRGELNIRREMVIRPRIDCVALRFFANGSFLYNVGEAEHLSKATVCRAVRKVCLAMKRLLPMFVVFPGHKPVRAIKEVLGGGLRG
ncbi:hypothetical protein N1851_023297 [Merluccius polli]|uniref:Nuclease HARBI1 n=1 Tax=Merluccius polli TaxID=89951 RepID=A0AA47MGS0_MERPO|nr:hypothetical protein N1851_023297 [Merluccius polli]